MSICLPQSSPPQAKSSCSPLSNFFFFAAIAKCNCKVRLSTEFTIQRVGCCNWLYVHVAMDMHNKSLASSPTFLTCRKKTWLLSHCERLATVSQNAELLNSFYSGPEGPCLLPISILIWKFPTFIFKFEHFWFLIMIWIISHFFWCFPLRIWTFLSLTRISIVMEAYTQQSDTNNSLEKVSCSHDEAFKYLSTWKTNTATGPDGISGQMIRGTAEAITPAITDIMNQSLKEMKVRNDWKISNVTPIPKDGDPSLATNYRPISLLPIISKIMEKIIHHNSCTPTTCSPAASLGYVHVHPPRMPSSLSRMHGINS